MENSKQMKRSGFLPRTAPIARKPASVKPAPEPKPPKGPRQRKCAVRTCRNPFFPDRPFIRWCSDDCAHSLAMEKLAKQKAAIAKDDRAKKSAERKADKEKAEQYKPLPYWLKKTERACNAYIRARDPDICISCGVTYSSAWQAGHYIAVGANATLRFNEFNINKQCIQCNMFEASNATNYRIGLIEKIGLEKVEWLEGWHDTVKMTRAACEEIEAYYKTKLKELKK